MRDWIREIRAAQFGLRRRLRITPIYLVQKGLLRKGVSLSELRALEVFGGTGLMHTADYLPRVRSLEAWELSPSKKPDLEKNLPTATVRIVDSYRQLRETDQRFGLIVADSWTQMFADHCEHFELFPEIFRPMEDFAVLVLNVMPEWRPASYRPEHLQRRRAFYRRDDVTRIPPEALVERYRDLARENGFDIVWWFLKDRFFLYPLRRAWSKCRLCYLVLGLSRRAAALPHNPAAGSG